MKITMGDRGRRANRGFLSGVNLGGWLSQYEVSAGQDARKLKDHFDTFITEADIRQIASWGMDHVRLPVDYPVLMETDEKSGAVSWLEEGFSHIDDCAAWCRKYGLSLVLDLHKAPGFSFFDASNALFASEVYQRQLTDLWMAIADRYKNEGEYLRYELLNEVKDTPAEDWNKLAQRLIDAIRTVDQRHYIVVGSVDMNHIERLPEIQIFEDDRIVYNFHMYIPILLTHQKADFMPFGALMEEKLPYPCKKEVYNGEVERMMEKMKAATGGSYTPRTAGDHIFAKRDIDLLYLREVFAPARDFIEKHDLPVYCGEYGMIDHADQRSVAHYVGDIGICCHELGIGRAVWNYKGLGFALVDRDGAAVSEKTVEAAAKIHGGNADGHE